jgi:Putative zinc-finger
MMRCLNDGTLLAFLDAELDAAERSRAEAHLAECGACRQRSERLQTTAARVNAWLDGLHVDDSLAGQAVVFAGRSSRPAAPRLGWGLALAFAVLLLAFLVQKPAPAPRVTPVHQLSGFIALDDGDPIQMGVVVRMNVSASSLGMSAGTGGTDQIAADVVIGEDGRARAIRFLE